MHQHETFAPSSPQGENLYAEQCTHALEIINSIPACLSCLYDLNMMPEQLRRGSTEWDRMMVIAFHFEAALASLACTASEKRDTQNQGGVGGGSQPDDGQLSAGSEGLSSHTAAELSAVQRVPDPPASATPRTDALMDKQRALPSTEVSGPYVQMAHLARTLERELSAATERLNAPVPDVEAAVYQSEGIDGEDYEVVPADLARDLGRRLTEAQATSQHWLEKAHELQASERQLRADQQHRIQSYADLRAKFVAAESARDEAVAKKRPIYAQGYEAGRRDERIGIVYANDILVERMDGDIAAIRGSSEGGDRG